MMFPDFIPIEYGGMSILTAIVLFFAGIGGGIYAVWDKTEHSRNLNYTKACAELLDSQIKSVDNKVDLLFLKNEEFIRDVSYIKTHVAGIRESVAWIKDDLRNKD